VTTNQELEYRSGLGLTSLTEAEVTEMVKLGITRRPIDSFCVGAFRYSNLNDAIAQAKRQLSDQVQNGSWA
jgi:hypothetical protein